MNFKNKSDFFGDRIAHAYLFVGASESDQDAILNELISKTGCLKEDMVSIADLILESKNSSTQIKVESVRNFIRQMNLSPIGSYRIGAISDADLLNNVAANALLKTIEEPPKNTTIVLFSATENVLATVRSRCHLVKVNSVKNNVHTFSYKKILSSSLAESFKLIDEVVKDNQIDVFFDEMLEQYKKDLEMHNSLIDVGKINDILITQKRINQNANKQIAIKNLLLKLKNE